MKRIACLLMVCVVCIAHADEDTLFQPADLSRIADLGDPALSHDGNWVAYTISSANADDDQSHSDLWRVRYDGSQRIQLTHTPDSNEWRPRWSNDGAWVAFLSNRPRDADASSDDATTQVWLMPAHGGEARRLTDFADGVEDFVWSPDAKQLAVIAIDPEFPADTEKPKNPPPIVTERYQFKEDGAGYLDARRKHLYLFDIASGKAELLTPGAHDEQLPAWSPDGKTIAYVTKRGADPDRHLNYDIYLIAPKAGAPERQLTTFPGADLDPYWETYPAWSPDSTRIAYLQSGEDKWVYYAPWQLAVIDVASGKSRIPAPIDRCFTHPRWAADGRHIFALVEQSLVTHVARIDLADGTLAELDHGARFDYDLDVAGKDRIVVLGGDDLHPYALAAVEANGLRALGDHNAWLDKKTLAKAEAIRFDSADGTAIEGLLVKPVGYRPGTRYPTIVRLHGGPVYQFSREFMADWQVYAANGFAVLAINPRGSSGRGFDFARAIYADWGNKDVQDVLAGVDHVVKLGIADPARLGVGGWSYGAILTNAVIASDARFKAAVSGAGASNMYAMYGHDQYIREYTLELGSPWKDRALYDRASFPFLSAGRITTPTLFQCAEKDFNVPCLGAEQMYQALRERDVPTRLVIYPGENHGLSIPSYLRDRMQRNLAWYQHFLRP
ncbi:S9 family peptidase [Dokdonella immobilis]|uniref:Dipeptidyl aminopeptidase/acylaminoacyl peptidase n=1 Tax=Dokdonella immobilis TaxID=578942 RepID=A0A1I4X386_9GAMM|nr:S9 family peptidase [Dokdonella immobilis]SFN19820.1 Dipeptidyl aminopeptidase/acylaminoacyl peptidase [Dokdonella immobilis]